MLLSSSLSSFQTFDSLISAYYNSYLHTRKTRGLYGFCRTHGVWRNYTTIYFKRKANLHTYFILKIIST